MEYPILFAVIIFVLVIATVVIIHTLTKTVSGKKNGAFRVKFKIGRFEFELDFSSSKT